MMLVPIIYMPQFSEQLSLLGVSPDEWLASGGYAREAFNDLARRVPLAEYAAMVSAAVSMSGEPGLGLLVGRGLGPASHGVVGLAASSAASIADALAIAERFVPLRTPLVTVRSVVTGDEICVILEAIPGLGEAALTVLEITLAAIKNVADHMVLGESVCSRVQFAYPSPPQAELASGVFGCRVDYDAAWTGLVFPLAAARAKLSRHDAFVLDEALRVCQAELERTQPRSTLGGRLERLILERKGDFMSLERAAQMMNMTARTLERRLVAEGTSYHEIIDRLRRRLAYQYLCVDKISTKEAAFLLGYSDVANFRRAFKRWEGKPPARFREEHAKS